MCYESGKMVSFGVLRLLFGTFRLHEEQLHVHRIELNATYCKCVFASLIHTSGSFAQ